MNKMNRKLEYSLIALKHMSQKMPGELTTAKEVSESYQAPFDATARVMQVMAGRGLLKSEQGATGGYQITKDLSKITLHELMETIQGPTKITKCMQHQKTKSTTEYLNQELEPSLCEIQGSCNIISPIANLNSKLTEFYKSVSLRDLLTRN